jgi:predicted methyltransferase
MKVLGYRILSGALVAALWTTLSLGGQTPARRPAAGQLAPAFTATSTEGRPVSLSDYKGKVVLIEFWASFCTVCVADLPTVKQLYEKYSAKGFNILGISMDVDAAAMRAKVKEAGLPWTQIMDGKNFDGELPNLYAVQGTPTYFVLDRSGRIALRTGDSTKLDAAIATALSAASDVDPTRDSWQRPAYVMDELGIAAGSSVADVGAGDGYFTMHLADRVGDKGAVYAVDINSRVLATIDSRAAVRGYKQVITIQGVNDDPRLPEASLDAILIVNAYHEMVEFDAMLRAMYRALKPGGRLAVIDANAAPGLPRTQYQKDHHIPQTLVSEDAVRNGFKFRNTGEEFRNHDWHFTVFTK